MKKQVFIISAMALFFLFEATQSQVHYQNTTTNNTNSSAIGYGTVASGEKSFASGINSTAEGICTSTLGQYNEATGHYAVTIGCNLKGTNMRSMVIGSGYSDYFKLENNKLNSLMVGYMSQYPTLFVGTSPSYNKTGRIGIGNVSNPLYKLHIKADEGEAAAMIVEPHNWRIGSQASLLLGNNLHGLTAESDKGLILKTEKDYYLPDGRVGINLENPPTAKDMYLTVKGSQIIYGPNASLFFGDNENTLSGYGEYGIEYLNDGLNFWIPWAGKENETERFMNYVLFLKDNGHVGIGTSEPTKRLDVNGTAIIREDENPYINVGNQKVVFGSERFNITAAFNGKIWANEIEVSTDSWPDYVFEDDYRLPALTEVEAFINNNKHLPGVPSEKEVLEEGINLGEMDAVLLQKIEELTLYVIELKKELEELKQSQTK